MRAAVTFSWLVGVTRVAGDFQIFVACAHQQKLGFLESWIGCVINRTELWLTKFHMKNEGVKAECWFNYKSIDAVVEAPYTTGLSESWWATSFADESTRLPRPPHHHSCHHLHPLLSQPLSRPKSLPSLPLSPPPNQIVRPPFFAARELDDGRGQLRLLVARQRVMSAATRTRAARCGWRIGAAF